jgi:hypothetical protein
MYIAMIYYRRTNHRSAGDVFAGFNRIMFTLRQRWVIIESTQLSFLILYCRTLSSPDFIDTILGTFDGTCDVAFINTILDAVFSKIFMLLVTGYVPFFCLFPFPKWCWRKNRLPGVMLVRCIWFREYVKGLLRVCVEAGVWFLSFLHGRQGLPLSNCDGLVKRGKNGQQD